MLTTETPTIGSTPPSDSSLPPSYRSTGEQIKDPLIGDGVLGDDGTVDGKSRVFLTLTSDVIDVDLGIRRFTSITID